MSYKDSRYSHCRNKVKVKLVTLKEKGMTMVFDNPLRTEVTTVTVDPCAISTGKRCDWLVVDANQIEYFVELKGTNISHGCKQLETAIRVLSENPAKGQKESIIVCARVPPAVSQKLLQLKAHFKRYYSSGLVIKATTHTVRVS